MIKKNRVILLILFILIMAVFFLIWHSLPHKYEVRCISVFDNSFFLKNKTTRVSGEFYLMVKNSKATIDMVGLLEEDAVRYSIERTIILHLNHRNEAGLPVVTLENESRHGNDSYNNNDLSRILFGSGDDELRPVYLKKINSDTFFIGNTFSPVYLCIK